MKLSKSILKKVFSVRIHFFFRNSVQFCREISYFLDFCFSIILSRFGGTNFGRSRNSRGGRSSVNFQPTWTSNEVRKFQMMTFRQQTNFQWSFCSFWYAFLLSFDSKAKVLYKLFRTEPRKSDDLVPVMDKLRIPREDDGLLKFWMRALTDEYKAHVKELTSMPTTGGPARESTKSFISHDQKVFHHSNDLRQVTSNWWFYQAFLASFFREVFFFPYLIMPRERIFLYFYYKGVVI